MVGYRYDFPDGTAAQMEALLKEERDASALRRIQCIYFRCAYGMLPEQIARMTGFSVGTVRNLHSRFYHEGVSALEIRPRGGRLHSYLTPEEESAFLAPFFAEAEAGGILEVSRIHAAFEARVGHRVYKPTVYDLLHRHGWRKIAPRPTHPSTDEDAQAAFKKTGRRSAGPRSKKRRPPAET